MKIKILFFSIFCLNIAFSQNLDLSEIKKKAQEMAEKYSNQASSSDESIIINQHSTALPMPLQEKNRVESENKISEDKVLSSQKVNNKNTVIKQSKPKVLDARPNNFKKFDLDSVIKIPFVKNIYSVVEFPFRISQAIQSSNFIKRVTGENIENSSPNNNMVSSFDFKDNKFYFKANISGKISFTVFGGAFPVTLEIHVNENTGTSYALIVDPSKKKEKIALQMQNINKNMPLDTTLVGLTSALARNTIPIGFEEVKQQKIYYNKRLNLTFIHERDLTNQIFTAEKWSVVNNGKKSIQIYEEMFLSQQNIISVCLEDDVINPSKSANIFIIKIN